MWRKKMSGLIGMVVGAVWFLANIRHFGEQCFVAVGLPIAVFVFGVIYFRHFDGHRFATRLEPT